MKDGQIVLSKRLMMLAEMVTPGNRVADVGCDHGFLSVYLVQKRISPYVLAMDVRKGPLAAASGHIESCGLGAYIETRLSDGLEKMSGSEADTVVCAGMGGRLMERILTEGMEKAKGMKELILQPQSELREFRAFLRRSGFRITDENAVYEEGKYYFAMRAVYMGKASEARKKTDTDETEQNIFDEYGELLLQRRHPVLKQYLLFQRNVTVQLQERLAAESSGRASARLAEIRRELAELETALERFPASDEESF